MKTTMLFLSLIFSLTALGQGRVLEADKITNVNGSTNQIGNPSCFKNVLQITPSAGAPAVVRSTSVFMDATNTSCTIDASASAQTYTFLARDLVRYQTGQNCEAKFRYTGDGTLYKVYARLAGVKVSSEIQLENESNSREVSLNFPCGSSTTDDPDLVVEVTGASAAAINIGNVYFGLATNIGTVAQAKMVGTYVSPGTGSCAWSRTGAGSNTLAAFSANSSCLDGVVTGNATISAGKIPGATFSSVPAGQCKVTVNFVAEKTGASDESVVYDITDGTTSGGTKNDYVATNTSWRSPITLQNIFTYNSAQTNVTFQVRGATLNTSNTVRVSNLGTQAEFSLYVECFPLKSQEVMSLNTLPSPQSAHVSFESDCTFNTTAAAYASFSNDATCTLTQRSNIGFGTITSLASTTGAGLSITRPESGSVRICATSSVTTTIAGPIMAVRIFDSTNAYQVSAVGIVPATVSNSGYTPFRICGDTIFTKGVAQTIRLQGQTNTGTIGLPTFGQVPTVDWTFISLSPSTVPMPLVKQAVATEFDGVLKVLAFNLNCNSASTISNQLGGAAVTTTNISSGNCTVTFPVNYFSAGPICASNNINCSASSGSACFNQLSGVPTTTGFQIRAISDTSSISTGYLTNIICVGPR